LKNNTDLQKAAYNNGFAAQDSFRTLYANLLASFNSDDVANALLAHIRLEHQDELIEHTADFSFLVTLLERSFLALYERVVIVATAPITGRGEQELQSMRARTGIGYIAPATAEEVAQSAEADLDAQVIYDWEFLPSDAVKRKINSNVAYRAAFERLSKTDALQSSGATTHINIGRL
jgi:hypothetical protein